jgi:hypothetical protein
MKKALVLLTIVVLMVFAGAVAGGAIKFGGGPSATGASGVSVLVTRDFGVRQVDSTSAKRVRAGETVMRFLQRRFDVTTRYGGGFVQSIEGLAGGRSEGRRVDWFYYVNGIEASEGAASRKLEEGDSVWWDRHEWGAAQRIPAVVGSFPEPFVSGEGGRKLPLSLVCAAEARSCDEVAQRLTDAGAPAISRTGIGAGFGGKVLRVVVGPWTRIRSDPAVSLLAKGPGASGVFARPRADGALELLDPEGRVSRTIDDAGGLVAATRFQEQFPTWIVTGTDDAGVAAAAASLQERSLQNHFAVAVEEGRGVPLPVQTSP